MTILNGKEVSKTIKNNLKSEVKDLIETTGIVPSLSIILVGNNPASEIYVRNKIKAANYCGINANLIRKDEDIQEEELVNLVNQLNEDQSCHGIIVQLPLPKHINEQKVIDAISYKKDVDGFGIINKGRLFSGLDSIESATPHGIIQLLDAYDIELAGKNAVVIGRSNIVGKPMALLLLNRNATVTICHSRTKNLSEITKTADILVVAIGKPKFITADMVKKDAVVIDVGTNRVEEKLCGDVDFEEVSKIASYISPVPGGVGPLTIASLLENTVKAYKKMLNIEK